LFENKNISREFENFAPINAKTKQKIEKNVNYYWLKLVQPLGLSNPQAKINLSQNTLL